VWIGGNVKEEGWIQNWKKEFLEMINKKPEIELNIF